MYRVIVCLVFLCQLKSSASVFIAKETTPKAPSTLFRSTQTFALSNDVQQWFKSDKKTSAWDPVKLWDELVSRPVRRHVEYGTPTISLGRQQVTRSNRFDDILSSMKENMHEASAALGQLINDAVMKVDVQVPQPLAQQGEWGAFRDEDGTGRIYYFNVVTGESCWNPPTSDFPLVEEPPRLLVAEGHWAAYLDEKKKSVYYFNRKTGQTTWNRPYPSFPQVSRKSLARSIQRPLAANGEWSAYLDDKKNVYYFNDVTGESTWQAPKGFPNLQATEFVSTFPDLQVAELVSTFQNWFSTQKSDPWLEDVLRNIPSFFVPAADQVKEIEWISEWKQNLERQMDKASSTIKDSWSLLDYFGRSRTFSAKEFPFAATVINYVDEILSTAVAYFPELDMNQNIRRETTRKLPTVYPDLEHLTRWKRNSDGTITGSVRHSLKHPVGTVITTSPATRGSTVAKQNVVRTMSGTEYYLL